MIYRIILVILCIETVLGKNVDVVEVKAGQYIFNCRTAGMKNPGEGVILLHGFPTTSYMYVDLMALLAENGYRAVAPDQRGYSPKARPKRVKEYGAENIINDVFLLADVFGFDRFHLIGHDWGASIGWGAVTSQSDRIISWTALSVPHPKAFFDALETDDDQKIKSRYFKFFKIPYIPELFFSFNNFRVLTHNVWTSSTDKEIEKFLDVFRIKGTIKGGLNWYRANLGSKKITALKESPADINTPTLFIWGNQDPALGRRGTELTLQYMKGPYYRFIEIDAGHWLIQDAYDEVSEAILDHLELTPSIIKQQSKQEKYLP